MIIAVEEVSMRLKRFDDWPERLDIFIKQRMKMKFKWGGNDCCTFTADAIIAMTGKDIASSFRMKYNSRSGAARFILQYGSLFGLACSVAKDFNLKIMSGKRASRGDMVYIRSERDALGVMNLSGDGAWFVTESIGLSVAPVNLCIASWRI